LLIFHRPEHRHAGTPPEQTSMTSRITELLADIRRLEDQLEDSV
jgi:hypothetical protein